MFRKIKIFCREDCDKCNKYFHRGKFLGLQQQELLQNSNLTRSDDKEPGVSVTEEDLF